MNERKTYPSDVDEEWALDARLPDADEQSGDHAGYDGAKRRKGSKTHMVVDTLGHLLALLVTPADGQDRAQVGQLAQAI